MLAASLCDLLPADVAGSVRAWMQQTGCDEVTVIALALRDYRGLLTHRDGGMVAGSCPASGNTSEPTRDWAIPSNVERLVLELLANGKVRSCRAMQEAAVYRYGTPRPALRDIRIACVELLKAGRVRNIVWDFFCKAA